MNKVYSMILIAVISVVTVLLRFIPFWLFKNKKTPKYIEYLGKVLPYSIMGMLVVYCLKNTTLLSSPYGIPELVACLAVVVAHVIKRNTLISILSGTAVYMVLVQLIF